MRREPQLPIRLACILLFGVLGFASAFAQSPVNLSLTMSPRPSPYLSDWSSKRETVIVTVTNNTSETMSARFDARLTLNSTLTAETKFAQMPVVQIPPGVSTFFADQILPGSAVTFYGNSQQTAVQTGMLPAGSYQLCVNLLDANNPSKKLASIPSCKNFNLTGYQRPQLTFPADKAVLAKTAIPTFKWIPVTPNPSFPLRYRLMVFEVKSGQTPIQAFKTNQPIISRYAEVHNQMLWPHDVPFPGTISHFVWTVRAVDENNQPVGDPDGYAQPFSFTISSSTSGGEGGNGADSGTGGTGTGGTGTGGVGGVGGQIGGTVGYPMFTDPYEFTPKSPKPFSGIVRDAITSMPVANATVLFSYVKQTANGFKEQSAGKMTVKTDASGKFTFASVMAPTFFSLKVTRPGYSQSYEIGPAQKIEGAINNYVVLVKPARLAMIGKVVDKKTNKAVPNAVVELWKRGSVNCVGCPQGGGFPINIPGGGISGGVYTQTADKLIASTKSLDLDEGNGSMQSLTLWGKYVLNEGSFTFSNLQYSDQYYLKIRHPHYKAYDMSSIPVGVLDTIDLGSIKIDGKRGTLNVTVKDKKTGKPIQNASVKVFPDVGAPANALPAGSGGASQVNASWNPALGITGMTNQYINYSQSKSANRPYVPPANAGGVPSGGSGGSGGVAANWTAAASGWTTTTNSGSGSTAPEKMPAIPALYSAKTDMNGKAMIQDVVINDPDQTTDRYAVWVNTPMYGDAWKPARLTTDGQVLSITILQDSAKGFIEGIVKDKTSTVPIANCKVELYQKKSGQETVIKTSYTNPDGTYTIYPVAVGTYSKIVFSKQSYGSQTNNGPIEMSPGTMVTSNANLLADTGSIKLTVKDASSKVILPNAMVHSPDVANITGVTALDGTTFLQGVPTGKIKLVVTLPGYADANIEATVQKNNTAQATALLVKASANIDVLVTDSLTHQPLANATVSVAGTSQKTNVSGIAKFTGLPLGMKNVVVIADTTGGKDYKTFSAQVVLNQGYNDPINIQLLPGTRISGKVTAVTGNLPLEGVVVSVNGVAGVTTTTKADGTYLLRNVPAGVKLKLSASKPKYMLGKDSTAPIQAGKILENINFALNDSPIDSIYGFAIILDTISDGPGGSKFLKGKFTVPDNLIFTMDKEANFKFTFENLEVDGTTMKPVAASYYFPYDAVPIKIFDAVGATMSGGNDFLRVTWDSVNNTGTIQAKEVKLKGMIPDIVPGAKWASEKLSAAGSNANSLGFWADGNFHGGSLLRLNGNEAEVNFWGFKLAIDYTKTAMGEDGFHYVGSLTIPKINKTIAITDLFFKLEGEGDAKTLSFDHVNLENKPPLAIDLWAFKFVDSTISWNQQGLNASGSVILTKLGNRTFRFQNMTISKEGKFTGVKIIADNSNLPITVLGAKFYITALGFATVPEKKDNNGTVTTPETNLFTFSGNLEIPQFSKKITFDNLTFSDKGDFTGTITFNQSMKFFNTVELSLQAIEFGKQPGPNNTEKKFIFVKGGVAFSIPLLSVQVGNFRFFEDKTFAVENIGFAFTAGPVNVSLSAQWNDSSFSGTGMLAVQPVLSVAGSFYYKDGNNWKIEVAANTPPIPIGPVAITGISGMLARKNGYWAFGFGGSVATAAGKESMELTLKVAVETTPNGPIIQGDAWLKTLGVQIGEAHITVNIPEKRFFGSIKFGIDKKAVKITGFIDFEVKTGVYWFVGGGATFDFLKVAQVNTQIFVGKNYPGFAHTLPALYHPDNEVLNGLHFDASTVWPKIGKDGDIFHLEFGYYLFGAFNWDGNLSAGLKMKGNAALDVWVVGFTVDVEAQAAIKYQNNTLAFSANADLQGKAWVWPCDKNSSCEDLCKFCPCIHFHANYTGTTGWDVDFNLGCD
ncbi:MAG: carboxypeptidase regulatory-like domain-containing protein [Candidatus Kapaibacterium sp.]